MYGRWLFSINSNSIIYIFNCSKAIEGLDPNLLNERIVFKLRRIFRLRLCVHSVGKTKMCFGSHLRQAASGKPLRLWTLKSSIQLNCLLSSSVASSHLQKICQAKGNSGNNTTQGDVNCAASIRGG